MAHIQLYYRDLLKGEVELQSDVTTIGRSRITSYNVCYTKLLRGGRAVRWAETLKIWCDNNNIDLELANTRFRGHRITSYNVCYTKLLR